MLLFDQTNLISLTSNSNRKCNKKAFFEEKYKIKM